MCVYEHREIAPCVSRVGLLNATIQFASTISPTDMKLLMLEVLNLSLVRSAVSK